MTIGKQERVVVTGIGMITPLGSDAAQVLQKIRTGASAARPPTGFDASAFGCPLCAQLIDFDPKPFVSEPKMVRLMNRDAQLAVAAARLALEDARVTSANTYAPEEIALFGATGLAGLPLGAVAPLIRVSAGPNGAFDLRRFGQAGLKAVSPILSFKILSNMPLCFVSINENIRGPNAIYTPWEGEGAQAIEAGVRALQGGDARCALVGGCDVKTHELAFASLQQMGLFDGWSGNQLQALGAPASSPARPTVQNTTGDAGVPSLVPAEGAAFLVLETEKDALARKARQYCCVSAFRLRPHGNEEDLFQTRLDVLRSLTLREAEVLVGSANGDERQEEQESAMLEAAQISVRAKLYPKKQVGDLFAAAGLLQVAFGAALIGAGAETALVNCFGHGTTQAAFVLEKEGARPRRRRQGCRRSQGCRSGS
jgi:3-oxoacyl-(acyl-carrier-protein) synthase